MSEYKATQYSYEDNLFYKVENQGRDALTAIGTHHTASDFAEVLNTETAPLHAEIARLKAELAKEEDRCKQLIEAIRHAKHDIGDGNFSRAHSILDLALWVKPDQDLLVESEAE
jgi:uncharacterized small protein (DUF1192 family)